MAQTSLISESVSMCLQTRPPGVTNNGVMAINEQKVENILSTLPNVQPGDEKFYQDILVSFHSFPFFLASLFHQDLLQFWCRQCHISHFKKGNNLLSENYALLLESLCFLNIIKGVLFICL